MIFSVDAGSANGRPMDSESINLGSNPRPAAFEEFIRQLEDDKRA